MSNVLNNTAFTAIDNKWIKEAKYMDMGYANKSFVENLD